MSSLGLQEEEPPAGYPISLTRKRNNGAGMIIFTQSKTCPMFWKCPGFDGGALVISLKPGV